MIRKQRAFVLISISVILITMLAGWWLGTGQEITGQASKLIAIGRLAGIVATASVLLELLVISRAPFIERNFDLEEIFEFHRYNGFTMVFALVAHMVFLVAGYGVTDNLGWWPQFLQLNTGFEGVLKATIGSIAFFVAAITSVRVARKRLPYEIWYFVHLIVYGGVLLAFGHQVHSGGDIVTQKWMQILWYMVYAIVFGLLAYYRFARQLAHMIRYDFRVKRVVLESPDIYSVYIGGRGVNAFHYMPGSYANFRFLSKDLWLESHSFSFSSLTGDDLLRITVRASGDHTKELWRVAANTRVLVDGPRGSFTPDRANADNVLLIAGGIGVAPFLALARHFLAGGKTVQILYSLHNAEDAVFKKEFSVLKANSSRFNTKIHVSSNSGRINHALLRSYISGHEEDICTYICGPDVMTGAVRSMLLELGMPSRNVIAERFTY